MPQQDAELDRFPRRLAVAWRAGEVRPTHRPAAKAPRCWRTRRGPFETTWPRVVQWLEAEPDRTAKELFDRLRRKHPGMFVSGQLRILQRRVKDWRRLEARRLMLTEPLERDANPNEARDDPNQADSRLLVASLGQEGRREPAHAR